MTKNVKIGWFVAGILTLLNAGCLLTSLIFWLASGPAHRSVPLTPEQMQTYKVEIEKIAPPMQRLFADTFAKLKDKGTFEKLQSQYIIIGKYAEGLYAIDVSNCPPDFQEAFLAFIRSMEKAKTFYQIHGGAGDVLPLLSDGLWGTFANAGKLTKEEQEVMKGMNESGAQLRLAAKKYNAKGF